MTCPHCVGADMFFDNKEAQKDLRDYRKHGPKKSAQMLLDAMGKFDLADKRLLDIGGGVGALQHEMLKAGAASAVDVDGSAAYIEASKEQAEADGTTGRFAYHHGDFVDIAPSLETADVVTLGRVLCCYPDVVALVRESTRLSDRFYGVVYPRASIASRSFIKLGNLFLKLKKNPFRAFVHDPERVDAMVRQAGFEPRFEGKTLIWHVVLYERMRDERREAPPEAAERAA